jgi:2-C-methyl-D-erythritol 4-phosphate cytidylyltransferase
MPMSAVPTAPTPRCFLVLPAAGSGQRMAASTPKQYLLLNNKPVIQHTLERIAAHPALSKVVIALAVDDPYWPAVAAALPASLHAKLLVTVGGAQRCDSVLNGLQALQAEAQAEDWVLVHDVVRPCLHTSDLERLVSTVSSSGVGGLLASPVRDTLKRTTAQQYVATTLERNQLWCAATPQMFRYQQLRDALLRSQQQGQIVTDEAQAVELCGHPVQVVSGRSDNIKLTFPEDMRLAELLLADMAKASQQEVRA